MDAQGLMRQASITAHEYLTQAIARIDEDLGKGYAAEHPELIAAFMNTAVRDFTAMYLHQALEELAEDIM